MARTVTSVVGGSPVSGAPGGTRESRDPARLDDVVASVELGDAGTFARACRVAHDAAPEWRAVPAPVRGRAIGAAGRLVAANQDALAAIVTREIGKPRAEALGEVQEIVDTCEFFLGEGRRLYGQTVPSEMPKKQLFTFRNPVGTAAIVTAGNFPVAVPSWYIAPALLCGNTVVWKPAEYAAASAYALAELFWAAGLPDGVLNLVLAEGDATFSGLESALESGHVDKVGFTGSSDVGRRVGELCGRHLQTPCLELGGKNPMVVMDDADVDLAVEGALFGGFGTAGPALHVARHADRPRGRPRRAADELTRPARRRADRRPVQGRPLRPDDPRALRAPLRGRVARADRGPPQRPRLRPRRAHHGGRAARRLRRRRPRGRALLPPGARLRACGPATSSR